MNRKIIYLTLVATVLLINIAFASVFVFRGALDITSSNSTIYLVERASGGVEIKRDLLLEDADRLIYMVDLSTVFNWFMQGLAVAKDRPILELTWNAREGLGGVKQFREDGTVLSLSLSRYRLDDKRRRGLFMGGDLPFGDASRMETPDSGGLSYFDGEQWNHIWCAANESFMSPDGSLKIYPPDWTYLESQVLKHTEEEVIIESDHAVDRDGYNITMKRMISLGADDDYYLLKITFMNQGDKQVFYNFSWGDEPWVGSFEKASRGDVGWYGGGLVKNETFILPTIYRHAGFWDYGNDSIGEGREFSGFANFVEWVEPIPSYVYFSNSFTECCNGAAPLSSDDNRVLNIIWNRVPLAPGEEQTHTLAIGMARMNSGAGMPVKPVTMLR